MFAFVLGALSILSLFSFSQDNKARLCTIQALNKQVINRTIINKPIAKPVLQNVGQYKTTDVKYGEKTGAVFAAIGYYGTKALLYGTAVAGAGAAITTVAPAVGTGAIVAHGAVGLATGGASAGASAVGASIAAAGLAPEAAVLTVNAVAATGGFAQTVAAVEGAATFMGWLGAMIPGPF